MKRHLEYSQIEKYIYIGTSICCKKHFQQLLKIGIKTDVDLQEEKEDTPSSVIGFLWLPVYDFTAPSQIQLKIGADFIANSVKNKMKCYIHCRAGEGRSPTLVAAYFVMRDNMKPEKAIKKIKTKRPLIEPNEQQVKSLSLFYKKLTVERLY
ncbi:MAG: dual specificity protein phosphatase family protein [Patescibacteria group bacterium]|jgi:atypical dual specificity phosphatase